MSLKITFDLPNGSQVVKTIPDETFGDDLQALYNAILRKHKEGWRDYLYARFGEDWAKHDPVAGTFWDVAS